MLRHIVTWKMNGSTAEERESQATELIEALRPLRDLVPTVQSLEVHRNEFHHDKNWDVILISEFADEAGLEAYDRHPEHQAVASLVRRVAQSRAGIDYTA